MKQFQHAIVRRPCKNMVKGISNASLGIPDYKLALQQHDQYIKSLQDCGLQIKILDAEEKFPDSCFVEDIAVHTPESIIITRPGVQSREKEIHLIESYFNNHFNSVEKIIPPGTLEGGDVLNIDYIFFVGISARTNFEGFKQFEKILAAQNLNCIPVPIDEYLHLKTGISYLDNNNLLISGELIDNSIFKKFNKIVIDKDEEYAANSLLINDKVIIPKGFPKTRNKILKLGYEGIIELNMSEFQKLDGGLSCLSIRY